MNPAATNFNRFANREDGSCEIMIYGCITSTALNYDSNANTNDGSCIFRVPGCMDTGAMNYSITANTDDGSCTYLVLGCTDSDAMNYNVRANSNDGSCWYEVCGCMDSSAPNYNPLANKDDGTCEVICPPTKTENTVMPSLSFGCAKSLEVLYDEWCHIMDEHAQFSTNDSLRAHNHHTYLVHLASEIDDMVTKATLYRQEAWN